MGSLSKILKFGAILSLLFFTHFVFADDSVNSYDSIWENFRQMYNSAVGVKGDAPGASGKVKFNVNGNIDHFGKEVIEAAEVDCNGDIGFCSAGCGGGAASAGGGGNVKISKDFAEFLDEYMPKCTEAVGCKSKAKFCGVGGHAKRNARNSSSKNKTGKGNETGTPSRHSVGDAMDLGGLSCAGTKIEFTKNGVNSKYKDFAKCWADQIKEARHSQKWGDKLLPDGKGCITCKGAGLETDDKDSDHDDHIHLSVPFKRDHKVSST